MTTTFVRSAKLRYSGYAHFARLKTVSDYNNDMPKRPQKLDRAEKTKNPAAVALGRLGGLKGGKARAESLSPERRSEIARRGGKNRWKNRP